MLAGAHVEHTAHGHIICINSRMAGALSAGAIESTSKWSDRIINAPAILTRTRLPTLTPPVEVPSMPAVRYESPAWSSCCPRQRERLQVGVCLHCFDNAFLGTVAGVFDAAERRHLSAIARYFPDIDGADLEFVYETCRMIEPVGADTGGKPKPCAIRCRDKNIDAMTANDRNDRTEGLCRRGLEGPCSEFMAITRGAPIGLAANTRAATALWVPGSLHRYATYRAATRRNASSGKNVEKRKILYGRR